MKKKTIANLLALVLSLSTIGGFASCSPADPLDKLPISGSSSTGGSSVDPDLPGGTDDNTHTQQKIALDAYSSALINCSPDIYQEYLAMTNTNDMAELLYNRYHNDATPVEQPTSKNVTLSWNHQTARSRYSVTVSKNPDLSNPTFTISTNDCTAELADILPGTYYWKVVDLETERESVIDTFVVENYVRALKVGSVSNLRDLGGWKTKSGKTIKYGLAYRSANITSNDGYALKDLGINYEIDLRAGSEYKNSAIPSTVGINYLQAGIMQSDYVLKNKTFYETLTAEQIEEKRHENAPFKKEYATSLYNAFKLFTDESNYPILFHCTQGADRTGTFAFLLSGMLGVGLDDLYRDFELTIFARGGRRWRSNIEYNAQEDYYYFNDDGYVTIPSNYVAIGLLYRGLMYSYATTDKALTADIQNYFKNNDSLTDEDRARIETTMDGLLSTAIKNYLKKDVGLTDADIRKIENIMLGENHPTEEDPTPATPINIDLGEPLEGYGVQSTSGNLVENDRFFTYDMIPVEALATYYADMARTVAVLDQDGNIITYVPTEEFRNNGYEIQIPENGAYLRVCGRYADFDDWLTDFKVIKIEM